VRRGICLIGAGVLLLSSLLFGREPLHSADGELGKPGCCRPESSKISQLHKNVDRLYSQFKAKEAVAELLKILQLDPENFEAHVKLARAHIDIGDMVSESGPDSQERQLKEYRTAEDLARKAITLNPNSTWGYFWAAVSVGNIAVHSPAVTQVELASEIRDLIEKAISLDPQNGFAYHAYGVWHRKMAEIGKTSRMFASVLYGRSLPTGSLEKSIEYLKKALSWNPDVIASRLELARSYVAVENFPQARVLLASIRPLPIQFSDDPKHKQKAQQLLQEINDR
jgi:tetratricopeptide (TPR) repeat protein